MRFLASPARATLIACVVGLAVATAAGRALAVGETITDVRVIDNQRTEESTVRSIAGVIDRRHLEVGHARQGARAPEHDRAVLRRQRLVGAAQRGRARQHLGQGQVPVGARPHRLVVGQQQVVRPAVRPRQPVRARQAAADRRPNRDRRLGRGASPTAIRPGSAAGSTGSCRATSSARSFPSTSHTTKARTWAVPVDAARRTASSRRWASPGSGG